MARDNFDRLCRLRMTLETPSTEGLRGLIRTIVREELAAQAAAGGFWRRIFRSLVHGVRQLLHPHPER
jgi:hypothetical protein